MGTSLPEIKKTNAEQWLEAQMKYHHGLCTGFWHKLFYTKTRSRNSRGFEDNTSASVEICEKCDGIRHACITVSLRNIFGK